MNENTHTNIHTKISTVEKIIPPKQPVDTIEIRKCQGLLIPTPLKDILVNLDIIAQIQKKQKLNVKTKNFADVDSWWDALWRRIYREDKTSSVEFIERAVESGIKAISDYPEFAEIIKSYLIKAREGILVEIDVYSKYPKPVGDLTVLLENISNI